MTFFSKFLIKVFLKIHYISYQQINKLSTKINGGVHPKHDIIKYYKFFLDNIEYGSKVLDVGCGYGMISYKIAKKAKFVVGIDIDENGINYAKKNYSQKNIEYLVADVLKYDFKENFDYIVLSNVLEHIKERVKFLISLKKLSKTLLIRVPMIDRSWITIYTMNMGLDYRLDSQHYIEYSFKSFQDEINKAGLSIHNYSIQFGEIWAIVKC